MESNSNVNRSNRIQTHIHNWSHAHWTHQNECVLKAIKNYCQTQQKYNGEWIWIENRQKPQSHLQTHRTVSARAHTHIIIQYIIWSNQIRIELTNTNMSSHCQLLQNNHNFYSAINNNCHKHTSNFSQCLPFHFLLSFLHVHHILCSHFFVRYFSVSFPLHWVDSLPFHLSMKSIFQ